MCIDMDIFNQNAIRGSVAMSICIYVFVDMSTCVKLNMRKRIVVSSMRVELIKANFAGSTVRGRLGYHFNAHRESE